MKRTLKFAAMLLGIVAMISLSSCKKDNEDLIIGKWNVVSETAMGQTMNLSQMGMTMTWEFLKDGTGKMNMTMNFMGQNMNESEDFAYTVDGDKLIMTAEGETETVTIVNLDKKVLELEMTDVDEDTGAPMTIQMNCERM